MTTRVFIDLDSGTVVNGPVFVAYVSESELDAVLNNDETARAHALGYGQELSIPPRHPDTDDGLGCLDCGGMNGSHYLDCYRMGIDL